MMRAAEELLEAAALRRLAERYAVAVDRGDGALFAAQFTAAGELIAPRGRFAGREELARVPVMMRDLYLRTFHAVLTQAPVFDGDRAVAETYCIARHYYRDRAERLMCYEMTIRYQDAFERTSGEWLIARRELIVDATSQSPVEDRGSHEGAGDGR
jgi:hypothetical protein